MKIKELYTEAKLSLKGKFSKMIQLLIVYGIFSIVLNIITSIVAQNNELLGSLLNLIISIFVLVPVGFGITAITLKLYRGEDINILDFFSIGFANFKSIWAVALRTYVKLLLPIIVTSVIGVAFLVTATISIFSVFGGTTSDLDPSTLLFLVLLIASCIWLYIQSIQYSLTSFILADNLNTPAKDIVQKSRTLMKNYVGKYILLSLSLACLVIIFYIVIVILSALSTLTAFISVILGIVGFVYLIPFSSFLVIAFYEKVLEENNLVASEEVVNEPIEE